MALVPIKSEKASQSANFRQLFRLLWLTLRELVRMSWQIVKPKLEIAYEWVSDKIREYPRETLKIGIVLLIGFVLWRYDLNLSIGNKAFGAEEASIENLVGLEEYKETIFTPKKGKNYNPQAPATLAELRDKDNRDYIKKYADIAVKEMHRTGIPASISMAQALIESRAGHSNLAKKSNNHFGIKCFSKNCRSGHCQNFSDDHHKDFFRNFNNPEESWKAHSELLQRPHYQSLKKNSKENYKAWARGLKQKGYATAGHYDKTLISIIERYDLDKLDNY